MNLKYSEYITSARWTARRNLFLKRHPKCNLCKRTNNLNVHHLSYDEMGREPDIDLMTLCESCHSFVHTFHGRHRSLDLREATRKAIEIAKNTRSNFKSITKHDKLFKPLRERMTEEDRKKEPLTGKSGRLGGLPIVQKNLI